MRAGGGKVIKGCLTPRASQATPGADPEKGKGPIPQHPVTNSPERQAPRPLFVIIYYRCPGPPTH